MTRECEVELAKVFQPFWKASMVLKRKFAAKRDAGKLWEIYKRRKAKLEGFLDCQVKASGVIGVGGTVPDWVGPYRGKVLEINARLAESQKAAPRPQLSAVL